MVRNKFKSWIIVFFVLFYPLDECLVKFKEKRKVEFKKKKLFDLMQYVKFKKKVMCILS